MKTKPLFSQFRVFFLDWAAVAQELAEHTHIYLPLQFILF